MLRTALLKASENRVLRREVERRGLTRGIAHRYIAGEDIDDGIAAARGLAREGRAVTLDYLGERVDDERVARHAAGVIRDALRRVEAAGLPCGVSLKPSQLGLTFAPELCRELVSDIAALAAGLAVDDPGTPEGVHVTLDMEASDVTEATVALVEELRAAGHRNVGCALQSALRRTPVDVRRLTAVGASLRLCKGAYAEPATVAHRRRAAVDASFAACADWLLQHGIYPRFATHDDALIHRLRSTAARAGLGGDAFELQMLYGVRPSLQDRLVRDGCRLRVYVPFGREWYPYFMRRLAERPANVAFFLRSLRDT